MKTRDHFFVLGVVIGAVIAACVVLLFTIASAGTITIDMGGTPLTLTSTATQDAAIQRLVDKANVQITEQNAANVAFNAANPTEPQKTITPLHTKEQYVHDVIVGAVRSWVQDHRAADATTACKTYRALSPLKQAAIMADLGNKSPCM